MSQNDKPQHTANCYGHILRPRQKKKKKTTESVGCGPTEKCHVALSSTVSNRKEEHWQKFSLTKAESTAELCGYKTWQHELKNTCSGATKIQNCRIKEQKKSLLGSLDTEAHSELNRWPLVKSKQKDRNTRVCGSKVKTAHRELKTFPHTLWVVLQ